MTRTLRVGLGRCFRARSRQPCRPRPAECERLAGAIQLREQLRLRDTFESRPGLRVESQRLAASEKWGRGQTRRADDPRLVPFTTYGRARRGIATGANSFFMLTRAQAAAAGLAEFVVPCLGKATHAKRRIVSDADV